ncbi:helix-turn-helix domain-containing protein [Actinomadura kijaniata]|uniref:helix-turn-helix domain-containing protein n=1 Tax=Actinomadura kijaniata TaxID=46161 RepID=UPI003F1AC29D
MVARQRSPELKAFGAEIRRRREDAGMSITHLAHMVTVSRSYVGQVEAGTTRCREDFARRVDRALNAGNEVVQAWHELIKKTKYPKYFVDFPKFEVTAVRLCAYETHNVYGPFQTEAYALTMLENVDAVEARMNRQQRILGNPELRTFAVLEESVLYREVGTPEVMRGQLEFLVELSHKGSICLQVLPHIYVAQARASFAIATQADRREAAFLVKAVGGETTTETNELTRLHDTFATLQAEALNVRDTRALIRKVIEERWS